MQKPLKGAIALGAAGLLLLGGAGTLALVVRFRHPDWRLDQCGSARPGRHHPRRLDGRLPPGTPVPIEDIE